jgi:hypothetical protein
MLGFFALPALLIGAHQQTAPLVKFAIVGARIEIGNGLSLEQGTVVFSNGKIVDIQPGKKAPTDATVIDGAGKVLYPGFIDAYSTRLSKSTPEFKPEGKPDATSTAPATMWIGNRKGIAAEWAVADQLDFEKDDSSYDNGVTTALLAPSRGTIRGSAAIVDLLPSTNKDRVRNNNFAMAMSFRGGTGDGYPTNVLGVFALLKQTLSDAKSQYDGVKLYTEEKKPTWMASLDALQPVVGGVLPGMFDVNLDREIERAMRVSDEFGFKLIVAGGRDSYRLAPELASRNIPVLLSIDYGSMPSIEPDKGPDGVPVEVKQERLDKWKEQIAGYKSLAKAGVSFAFCSGSSPSSFLENARVLIKNGADKDEVLRIMTSGAANLLGLGSSVGTIEIGKRANLVLMNKDFDQADAKPERVWIQGISVKEPKPAAPDKTSTLALEVKK